MWHRRVRSFIAPVVATLWTAGFGLLGLFRLHRIPLLISNGGQSIWVLAPHPDDEVIGCAFAVLRHAAAGDRVVTIFVTDGRRSRAFGLGPDEMARRRRLEAEQSQDALGLHGYKWLGWPEIEWNSADLVAALRSLSQDRPPDVIYAPSRVDFHPDHHKVARALAQFLEETRSQAVVRVVQLQVPMTSLLANLATSGEGLYEKAAAARAVYRTQVFNVEPAQRLRRYAGAFHRIGAEVEEYWELSTRSYCLLHGDGEDNWPTSGFEGIHFWPWSDPLRFARGRAERRRLRARVLCSATGGCR